MKITKNQAIIEFGLNLTEQKILTKRQFLKYIHNFSWRLWEFEIGYWLNLQENF